jgi:hypothetical protein
MYMNKGKLIEAPASLRALLQFCPQVNQISKRLAKMTLAS